MVNWKNVWLDDNELVLCFRNGKHRVMEKYEGYKVVFTGSYEECVKYMNRRELEYLKEKHS